MSGSLLSKEIPVSSYYIIYSFPLAVCKFGHARYCKMFRGYGVDYGKEF